MTRPGPKTLAALVLVVAGLGLAVAWDWNWFRDPLAEHLSTRSGRSVRLGDLHVSFEHFPDPTVRLRDVAIDNAPWVRATKGRPFVTAKEVAFTFAWHSLPTGRPVVSHLRLVDADVALERNADNLRNWRLREPDDRGDGKFKIQRLEALRSRLRFVHDGVGLDLRTAAAPLPAAQGAFTTRITFGGTWRDARFDGEADTPPALTFLDTGEAFALRGAATSDALRLTVDGTVTDLFRLDGIDADVGVSGPSFAAVRRLMPAAWPDTAAFSVAGHVAKNHDHWAFTDLKAEVGKSDIGGELRYNAGADRPFLEGELTSRVTRLDDVWHGAPPPRKTDDDTPPLRRFDADIGLLVRTLHLPHVPPLTQVRLKARLDDGLLDLTPVQARVADGELQGLASWDGRQQPPAARAELTWRNLRLEQLLPPLPDDGEATGPLSGQLKLTSHGDTLDALLAHASGHGDATLRGGRLSAGLDARLGLNGGRAVRAALAPAADVAILCARTGLVLKDGRGEVFPLLLDTAHTRVDGRGDADLSAGRATLLLTPRRKESALLALDRSLQVTATADGVDWRLVPQQAITPEVSCDTPAAVKAR